MSYCKFLESCVVGLVPANDSNCCKVCLASGDKDRKVRFCCKCCNVELCVVDCFWSNHNLVDFCSKVFEWCLSWCPPSSLDVILA